jgi:hypothetical protein
MNRPPPLSQPPPLSRPPALGRVDGLRAGQVAGRLALLVALAAVALVVKVSGVLSPDDADPTLPPMPDAAVVQPGLLRATAPNENDLVSLRDGYGVRAVISLGVPSVEEQATAKGLGLTMTVVEVATGAAPTPDQVRTVLDAARSTAKSGGTALLHDVEDNGAAPVMGAFVQLAGGSSEPDAVARLTPDEQRELSAVQAQALRDAGAQMSGVATGPWAALRTGVSR